MNKRIFTSLLSLTTAMALGAIGLMHYFFSDTVFWSFDITHLVFFFLLSILMYIVAFRAHKDENPYKFSRVFLLFSGAKIFLSLMIVLFFVKALDAPNRFFLITFLLSYIMFTTLETYVFMSLSKPEIEDGTKA